jgi:type III restriction enzyme
MKIQFENNLLHQKQAVDSIVGLFKGQDVFQSHFSVTKAIKSTTYDMFSSHPDVGVANGLSLLSEQIYHNTREIQLQNGLAQTESAAETIKTLDFSIDMETGTGKTYVYLKSIFELNQHFGFTKFIVVVPSLAIKEGVYKSLQITEDHFRHQYKNIQYDYFVYDSNKREQIRSFATNDYIQIMVINIDAFSKAFTDPTKENKANLIHRADDRLNGMKPIEFIQRVKPIVMIDEPQSVVSTKQRQDALATLNPLCQFRFSATHKTKVNEIYRLDALDAYNHKLVKQIEVASVDVLNQNNQAYIKLLSVNNKKGAITAQIELDVQKPDGTIKRTKIKVKENADLFELSNHRTVYEGYVINDIYCLENAEYIDFTSRDNIIRIGEAIGEFDRTTCQNIQIDKTVHEHFEKELRFHMKVVQGYPERDHSKILSQKGIKVLSLFFIDKVKNYRDYDDDGQPQLGKFALQFETAFTKYAKKPKYMPLYPALWDKDTNGKPVFNEQALQQLVSTVHNGYFAQDKKKKDALGQERFADSRITKQGDGGHTAADGSAYNLIMKDKERLLSMEENLRFIFSHSALKEGWDNPNVFQICTLNETKSIMKKRQEIGRGLRLAVDQSGNRTPYGFEVNTLTVMANESYEEFVKELQQEIETEAHIQFGVIQPHQFAKLVRVDEEGKNVYLGQEISSEIYQHLQDQSYIDKKGKVQPALHDALIDQDLVLPEHLSTYQDQIMVQLQKLAQGIPIKKHEDRKTAQLRQQNGKSVTLSEDFKALWDRIKYKTTYRVNFDEDQLIKNCIAEINNILTVTTAKYEYTKAKVSMSEAGLNAQVEASKAEYAPRTQHYMPDIVSFLVDATHLTRQTIIQILLGLDKNLERFAINPQSFIEQVTQAIKQTMQHEIVDGITYQRIGERAFYAQALFEEKELTGYLKNMVQANKSIYDHVLCDSEVESKFAEQLETATEVKLYAKLPNWFKIETPLGHYNPDWAILIDKEDQGEQLYFVVETKSSLSSHDLRTAESDKIKCGTAHFKALSHGYTDHNPAQFIHADSFDTFNDRVHSCL